MSISLLRVIRCIQPHRRRCPLSPLDLDRTMLGLVNHKSRGGMPFTAQIALVAVLILCSLWLRNLSSFSAHPSTKAKSAPHHIRGVSSSKRKLIRRAHVENAFGTLFHAELLHNYSLYNWELANAAKLLGTLRQLERTNITFVMFSVSWEYAAPDASTTRWEHYENLAETTCKHTRLKVAFILDMFRSPSWLFDKFPDAQAVDAGNRTYPHLSWFHGPANELALDMLHQVAERMAKSFPGCVIAMQPVYNNEYEAKYTQQFDSYQDYNSNALEAYRSWLQIKRSDLHALNNRWGTLFSTWAAVTPPALFSGTIMGIEDGTRYWDWMRFRVEAGVSMFNRACARVRAAKLQCFHHFPEFFTVLDAIYGAAMFKQIAASDETDFLVMDSNFMTPYHTVMSPTKLRLYISAAHTYNKPVYFEAALERYANFELLQDGYVNALLAGAANFGLTNWLGRIPVDPEVRDAMLVQPRCESTELVGVFIHLESCIAWQGPQWQWKEWDPLHGMLEDIAVRLSQNCNTDVAVYIELERFLSDANTFSRAVFVEPLVLYGPTELSLYTAAKEALKVIPHELITLPTNNSRGIYLKVHEEL